MVWELPFYFFTLSYGFLCEYTDVPFILSFGTYKELLINIFKTILCKGKVGRDMHPAFLTL